ncbi:MAG: glutamyl-tRNA reductase [Phycisphaerae bacterium]|nr:glutamyl-tRNA reductase [Phycisphaerae bacterium]
MRILCVGISHQTAPVAVRERCALDEPASTAALGRLAGDWPEAEWLVLSTCNRTELYVARPAHGEPRVAALRNWLTQAGELSADEADAHLCTLTDGEAIGHLFAVAAGLDSLVPGEGQIVAQLKRAYARARRAGTAREVLHEVVQAALHVAKRVRSETPVAEGKVSVASVAVDQAAEALGSLGGACALSIGAGKMTTLMLQRLRDAGVGRILLANRSGDKAADLADGCGGEPVAWADLSDALVRVDVVLTSTAAEGYVLTREQIAAAMDARGGRALVVVDVAVPRDVDPGAGTIDGVRLYDIDALERLANRSLAARRETVSAARRLIDEHVTQVSRSLAARQVAPTIRDLQAYMRRIADEELTAARGKLASHDDADADERILRLALHRTVRRICHPAAERLRDAAGSQSAAVRAAALRKLFRLDDE